MEQKRKQEGWMLKGEVSSRRFCFLFIMIKESCNKVSHQTGIDLFKDLQINKDQVLNKIKRV